MEINRHAWLLVVLRNVQTLERTTLKVVTEHGLERIGREIKVKEFVESAPEKAQAKRKAKPLTSKGLDGVWRGEQEGGKVQVTFRGDEDVT